MRTATITAMLLLGCLVNDAAAGPDTTPPRIVSIAPSPQAGVVDQIGVSAIQVGFDEAVAVPEGAVAVRGLAAGPIAVTTDFDFEDNVLTIGLPAAIDAEAITVVLDFTITDMAGNALDGEIDDPAVGGLPSGDGSAGGQAVFRIDVLQGDANHDGVVDAADAQLVALQLGLCAGDPGFDSHVDLNADGCVNVLDVAILQSGFGGVLPAGDGQGPSIDASDPTPSATIRAFSFETVVVAFDEPLDPAHIAPGSLFASQPDGAPQASTLLVFSEGDTVATFTFDPPLDQNGVHLVQLSNAVSDVSGELLSVETQRTWAVDLDQSPARIAVASPANGESGVAVTRETVIEFTYPIDPGGVSGESFFAMFGGEQLPLLNLHVSADGRRVTMFYEGFLPASALVRVHVVGNDLIDDLGNVVDGDGDGLPGGTGLIDFETVTLTTLPGTRVCGRVFASELIDGDGGDVNEPLAGVVITVDGAEDELFAVTDAKGDFCLDPAPVGTFFVHVDGQTATNGSTPEGAYYPFVGKPWTSIAGQEVNVGNVYLPLIIEGTLQPVSDSDDVEIAFPGEVIKSNPDFAGVQITVPAGSLFANDGTTGGQVGIAPVDPDRLPGQLPPGLEFPLVITVQTSGVQEGDQAPTNFDTPAPVVFPNVAGSSGDPIPPGAEQFLFSFNHDKGKWEAIGPMTVSDDGAFVVTDPGVGILAPGWHGTGPPPVNPAPPPCEGSCCLGSPSGAANSADGCDCDSEKFSKCSQRCTEDHTRCLTFCGASGAVCFAACSAASGASAFHACMQACAAVSLLCVVACVDTGLVCLDRCAEDSGCETNLAAFPAVGGDPILLQLLGINEQLLDLSYSFAMAGVDPPEEIMDEIEALLAQADAAAGGSAAAYLDTLLLEVETSSAILEAVVDEAPGNAPDHAVHYMAEIVRDDGEVLRLRNMTAPAGQYTIFVPPNGQVRFVLFYDVLTNSWGVANVKVRPDATYRLTRFYLQPIDETFADFDGDGLVDVAEVVLGTETFDPDTDGDGINDGAEIEQGTDPLDGLVVQTGIIATADTSGTAWDICAVGDLAIVADGESGVSVFNVFNGMDPTIIAQIDTPGEARAITCSGAGDRIAVADGYAGVAVIDISDPPAASIVATFSPATLGGVPKAVTSAGDIAFVGTNTGTIVAIDLTLLTIIDTVQLVGDVQDMAIEGSTLFVLYPNELHAFSILDDLLGLQGSVEVPGLIPFAINRKRLFVGGDVAYATKVFGYVTVDVSDVASMTVLTAEDAQQIAWHHIVANGTGLGIAAVGTQLTESDVGLFDVSDPQQNDVFLTSFTTPGLAVAASVYNGLAYVADSESGLQVVNYLAYDALGVPPVVSFTTSADGGTVEEGSLVFVNVAVEDDVQVRNVELLVDGEVVQTDGNFPFQFFFDVYILDGTAGSQPIDVAVRATDTGGNQTLAPAQSFDVIPDVVPPSVLSTSHPAGAELPEGFFQAFALSVVCSESLDIPTVTPASVRLDWAGPDGRFGTGDDEAVPVAVGLFNENRGVTVAVANDMPVGSVALTFDAAMITDRAGNFLDGNGDGTSGDDFVLPITVIEQHIVVFDGGGDGVSYGDPLNWSSDTVPDAGSDVAISGFDVSHPFGADDVGRLTIDGGASLTVTGGSLTAFGEVEVYGTLATGDGSFGGTVTAEDSTIVSGTLSLAKGTFDAVGDATVASGGTLALSSAFGTLTGTGTVTLASGSTFDWDNGAMSGTGTTVLEAGARMTVSAGGLVARHVENSGTIDWVGGYIDFQATTLTNQPGGVVNASPTFNGAMRNGGGSNLFENQGSFVQTEDVAFQFGVAMNNAGTVDVQQGTMSIVGGGTSDGTFDVSGSGALSFASTAYTLEEGSSVTGTGPVSFVTGSNVLDGAIASDRVITISGGTVALNPDLMVTGTLAVSAGSLSGPGTVTLAGGSNLTWSGGTMSGTGTTVLEAGATGMLSVGVLLNRGLENAGTIAWDGGYIDFQDGTLTNQPGGVINAAPTSNAAMRSTGGTNLFDNHGSFVQTEDVTFQFGVVMNNSGTMGVQQGTLSIIGGGTSDGTFDVAGTGALSFESTGYTLSQGSSVTGTGPVAFVSGSHVLDGVIAGDRVITIGGGNVTVNPDLTVTGTLAVSAGSLSGPGTVTLAGGSNLAWSGGTMSGTGTTVLEAGATGTLSVGVSLNRALENFGTINWNGGYIDLADATLTNHPGGVINAAPTVNRAIRSAGGTNVFDNQGSFAQTEDVAVWFGVIMNNGGTMDVQQGTLSVDGVGTTDGFLIAGVAGVITHGADFILDGAGDVTVRLGGTTPGVDHGQHQVTGTASLAGALTIVLADGYTPTLGDTYDVATYSSMSTPYDVIEGLDLGGGLVLEAAYLATSLRLTVVGAAAKER